MKTIATIFAAAALAAGISPAALAAGPTRVERAEARLAEKLAGRVAGEPVRCISAPRSNDLQVIDNVGVVYDSGDTIYVARPTNPRALGSSDALIIDRFGSQLCTSDMVRTFDRSAGHLNGVVFFEDFVPYKKA
jgi:hypothetical protein